MSPTFDAVVVQALALPPEQRFELAERLLVSVEGQFDEDKDQWDEIERREAEVSSGAVKPIPFEQAMRGVRDSLK